MPPNFPLHQASLRDVEVWESLPDDVRASVLRLHQEGYFGHAHLYEHIRNITQEAYNVGRKHERTNTPEYNFEPILRRLLPSISSHAL